MRAEVDKLHYGKYKFVVELDTGGDPDYPYTVWIYHEDSPVENIKGGTIRREFSKDYSEHHLRNFCKKFANKKEYREKWGVVETKELKVDNLRGIIKQQQIEKGNLDRALMIFENIIASNDDLKEKFIKEISKNDYQGSFGIAPLQIKTKKQIVENLNNRGK